MRDVLLRAATATLGWGGALLFLAGTVSLTGGRAILGAFPPAVAIVGGCVLAVGGFVVHLVQSDSVRPGAASAPADCRVVRRRPSYRPVTIAARCIAP